LSFAEIFGSRKLESLGYRAALSALSYVILRLAFSVEHRLVADGQAGGRTDRHMTTANTRAS